jgi:hypothetical protein
LLLYSFRVGFAGTRIEWLLKQEAKLPMEEARRPRRFCFDLIAKQLYGAAFGTVSDA